MCRSSSGRYWCFGVPEGEYKGSIKDGTYKEKGQGKRKGKRKEDKKKEKRKKKRKIKMALSPGFNKAE